MSVLNVAVVGIGIGTVHVEQGYRALPERFEVKAICGLDPEALAATADRLGIPDRTTRFDEVLARPDIDVIDVCTPPHLHAPQTLAALAAGKHVVCEKPLCGSLEEADTLAAAAEAAPGLLMPIFQYRYGDGVEQVQAILDAGIAGRPYLATAETLWNRDADYYAVDWRGHWETELGGVLLSQAIHIHDLATLLMGPVAKVFGRVATRVNAIEVEDCVASSCLLQSGALMSLSCTLGSAEQISRLRLAFENVTFESDHEPYNPGSDRWRIIPASDAVRARIGAVLEGWSGRRDQFAAQFARFHDAVHGRGPLPVTVQDARAALELATAIYASSASGREEALPIAQDHPLYASWRPVGP